MRDKDGEPKECSRQRPNTRPHKKEVIKDASKLKEKNSKVMRSAEGVFKAAPEHSGLRNYGSASNTTESGTDGEKKRGGGGGTNW